jgi:tetratricopeptide (TPR) repeat protein
MFSRNRTQSVRTSRRTLAAFLTSLFVLTIVVSAESPILAQAPGAENQEGKIQEIYGEARAAAAQGDLGKAIAKYEELLKVDPKLAPAYNNLGSLYLRQREYKKAADILDKGLKLDPKMTSATALLGIAEYEMGDYSGARKHLEAALRANPKDDNAELFLANNLIRMGELNAAIHHLEQLSARQPKNQEVLYLLGKVHMKLSEEALAKLNDIDPNSIWSHEISGEVMESMKNYDGALIEYKKAVELAPDLASAHFSLGNAYWALARWKDAAKEFAIVVSSDPGNCDAQWKIGNALLEEHENPEEALAAVNKALTICPNLIQARVDRAKALTRLDRNEEAVKDLRIAVKINPDEPSIHFLLGHALRSLGRMGESRAEMETFEKLQENAHSAAAERARQVLQNNNENNSPNQ